MRNYIQSGTFVTVPAPEGGVKSGEALQINALFGIAAIDGVAGEPVELLTFGVVELPKGSGPINVGAKVYWKSDDKQVVTTASGNTLIGVAIQEAAGGDDTLRLRLNGSFG